MRKQLKKITVTLLATVALAFTLSCSGGDDEEKGGDNSSSSGSGDNSSSSGYGDNSSSSGGGDNSSSSGTGMGNTIELDVIYRDFNSSEDWIQPFDKEKELAADKRCANGHSEEPAYMDTPRNGICVTGSNYNSCEKGGQALMFGVDNGCDETSIRGYFNGPDAIANSATKCWELPIFVTRDMVQKKLDYSQCSADEKQGANDIEKAINGRYCARPMPSGKPANEVCYGDNLEEWFTDSPKAKRINDVLVLSKDETGAYGMLHDFNTKSSEWNDIGFFPLDKYSDDLTKTWGKQNLNGWCGDVTNCGYYKGISPADAKQIATDNDELDKLHNYGFTMSVSGVFEYSSSANDVFEIIGDDDTWIFIDGVLFEDPETGAHGDLGGVHSPAPAKINIASYAQQKGWKEGSAHVINFFITDRNTDEIILNLRVRLNELKAASFGGK